MVVKASDPCGDALSVFSSSRPMFLFIALFCSADLGDFDKTFMEWKVTLKAGTQVQLSVVDANDDEAWSNTVSHERLGFVGIILTFPSAYRW